MFKARDWRQDLESCLQTGSTWLRISPQIKYRYVDQSEPLCNILGNMTTRQDLDLLIQRVGSLETAINTDLTSVQSKLDLLGQADEKLQSINDVLGKAEQLEKSQVDLDGQISEYKNLKESISTQLGELAGNILSLEFKNRANNLESSLEKWLKKLTRGTLFLVAIAVGAALWQYLSKDDFYSVGLVVKSIVALPVLYYVIFCNIQYAKDKRMLEEYAFKGAVSHSLDAHLKIIKQDLPDTPEDKSKYTVFLIETIQQIYTPPDDALKELSKDPAALTIVLQQLLTRFGGSDK